MMQVDVKRLNEAQAIDVRRAEAESDRQIERNRMVAALLASAVASPERTWVALVVANNSETSVEKVLIGAGFAAWAPCRKVETTRRVGRYHGKRQQRVVPAFPGYVFASLPTIPEAIAWLRNVDRVRGVVCYCDGRPVPISEKDLNNVKALVDKGWLDQTVEARRQKKAELGIEPGDSVVIEEGPMAMLKGVLEGYVGTRHVRVLMSLFGRQATVTLDLAQIAKTE